MKNRTSFVVFLLIILVATSVRSQVQARRVKQTPQSLKTIRTIGVMYAQGKSMNSIKPRWQSYISGMKTKLTSDEIQAIVLQVLRESYSAMQQDLQEYVDQMKRLGEMKRNVRDELKSMRDFRSNMGRDRPSRNIRRKAFTYSKGKGVVAIPAAVMKTSSDYDEYIEDLEEDLATIGDDSQLANIDLQNVLQKQQQVIQMLSNVAKVLHDTALAVIRKIG